MATLAAMTGGSGLILHDARGKPRVALGSLPAGRPELQLYDENGNTIWRTP